MLMAAAPAFAASHRAETTLDAVKVQNVSLTTADGNMNVAFDLDLSALKLKGSEQVIYTPIFVGEGDSIALGKIVVDGRDEQLRWERDPKRGARCI